MKPYLLDEEPADMIDLLEAAKALDQGFGRDGIYMTSQAAAILRKHGHAVRENKVAVQPRR